MRRSALLVISSLLIALVAGGCGSQSDATPAACREGEDAYLKALQAAPDTVELRGVTPISDCLAENQKAGDLAAVGTAMLAATTALNGEARAEPGGEANRQLGYLLGAAQHGAEDTNGIHAELIRRLSAAARYSPENRPLPAAFLRAYREGFDAGLARG